MAAHGTSAWRWLAAVVLAHLIISIVHGTAHMQAQVPMSLAANLFVFIVILAGPVAGLAWTWVSERGGSWVVAVTMAASFVFGVVNHFLVEGADNVTQVAEQSRALFTATAALVAITEVLGSLLAIRAARRATRGAPGSRQGTSDHLRQG